MKFFQFIKDFKASCVNLNSSAVKAKYFFLIFWVFTIAQDFITFFNAFRYFSIIKFFSFVFLWHKFLKALKKVLIFLVFFWISSCGIRLMTNWRFFEFFFNVLNTIFFKKLDLHSSARLSFSNNNFSVFSNSFCFFKCWKGRLNNFVNLWW